MDLRLIGWAIVILSFIFGVLILPAQGICNVVNIPVKVARWGKFICILAIGFLVIVYVSAFLK